MRLFSELTTTSVKTPIRTRVLWWVFYPGSHCLIRWQQLGYRAGKYQMKYYIGSWFKELFKGLSVKKTIRWTSHNPKECICWFGKREVIFQVAEVFILNQPQLSGEKLHQLQNLIINQSKLVVFYRWVSSIMLRKRLTCWRDWILIQSIGKEKEELVLEYFSRSLQATNQGKTPSLSWLDPLLL